MHKIRTFSGRGFLAALLLLISILLLQMIAMEFHHHDLLAVDDNCPSCQLGAMHPAPTPAAPVMVPVSILAFTYHVAAEPALPKPPDIRPYLSPYPQAPPRRFIPV